MLVLSTAILLFLSVGHSRADEVKCVEENDFQCNNDCTELGYCDKSKNWNKMFDCPDKVKDSACNDYCSCTENEDDDDVIRCSDPTLIMPDLENCSRFYICNATSISGVGYGILQSCPDNTYFDSCQGKCSNDAKKCTTDKACTRFSSYAKRLDENYKLGYVCNTKFTLWFTCPNGYFQNKKNELQCNDVFYGCVNGNGEFNESDLCENGPGIYGIPGITCFYVKCYDKDTYLELPCDDGKYFNKATKKCELGTCVGNSLFKEKVSKKHLKRADFEK